MKYKKDYINTDVYGLILVAILESHVGVVEILVRNISEYSPNKIVRLIQHVESRIKQHTTENTKYMSR